MTMQPQFDAKAYKVTTHNQWQEAAKAWNDWGSLLRTWLGPATDAMLDMAGVSVGSRVLDVAAGAGDQSLSAAERVGPSGFVLTISTPTSRMARIWTFRPQASMPRFRVSG